MLLICNRQFYCQFLTPSCEQLFFAGVIFTRADNEEINGIHDLKDKVIGAADVATITASQSQFYQMEKADMSYVMDPKKVTFTGDMQEVVKGVLAGEFDVGFVRTDEIEGSIRTAMTHLIPSCSRS